MLCDFWEKLSNNLIKIHNNKFKNITHQHQLADNWQIRCRNEYFNHLI